MTDYTISLSDTLSNFINQVVEEGGYENIDEYIIELLTNRRSKQLPNKLSDLQKLQLFNKTSEKLEKYQLWEYLENNPQTVTIPSKEITLDNFPVSEFIEAPLIKLRLFRQDNDHISIRNISKIYDSNTKIPNHLKTDFGVYRENFNNFLKQNSVFSIGSLIWINKHEHATTHYTNREILDSLLYGEIAHFTQMEDYQILYSNSVNTINLMLCMKIMQRFKNFILDVKKINDQAIGILLDF